MRVKRNALNGVFRAVAGGALGIFTLAFSAQAQDYWFEVDEVHGAIDFGAYTTGETLSQVDDGWGNSPGSFTVVEPPSGEGENIATTQKAVRCTATSRAWVHQAIGSPGWELGQTVFLSAEIRKSSSAASGFSVDLMTGGGYGDLAMRVQVEDLSTDLVKFGTGGNIQESWFVGGASLTRENWLELLIAVDLHPTDVTQSTYSAFYRRLDDPDPKLYPVPDLQDVGGLANVERVLSVDALRIGQSRNDAEVANVRWGLGSVTSPPETVTLTYQADEGGSISGQATQVIPYESDGTAVTAEPDSGYHFVAWSDGVDTATRQDTNVTEDITVTAYFATGEFTLTYTAGSGGSILGETEQTVPHSLDGTPVQATADPGYLFVEWSDGVQTATRKDTGVTANIDVTAHFAPGSVWFEIDEVLDSRDFGAYTTGETLSQVDDGWGNSPGSFTVVEPPTGDGENIATTEKALRATSSSNAWAHQAVDFPGWEMGQTVFLSAEIRKTSAAGSGLYADLMKGGGYGDVAMRIQVQDLSTDQLRFGTGGNITHSTEVGGASLLRENWLELLIAVELHPTDVTQSTYSAFYRKLDDPDPKLYAITDLQGVGDLANADRILDVNALRLFGRNDAEVANIRWGTGTIMESIENLTLTYTAGAGGAITGEATQTVAYDGSGTAVTAEPDAGAVFAGWSDGGETPERLDANVMDHVSVTAYFNSEGGVPIDWYDGYGIAPAEGQTWADVDNNYNPDKEMTLQQEYIAQTDPTVSDSVFQIIEIQPEAPSHIAFEPDSPDRVYTLQYRASLTEGTWDYVPGQISVPGGEGPLPGIEDVDPVFYRVIVELP